MLSVAFLLLGGVVLGGALWGETEPSSGSGSDSEADLPGDETSNNNFLDTLFDVHEMDQPVPSEENWIYPDAADDFADATDQSDQLLDGNDAFIDLDGLESGNYPNALADWVFAENVPQFELGESDELVIQSGSNIPGSILIMDADYIETTVQNGIKTITEHEGSLVFFVPFGESFPETYEWSEEGATLFNSVEFQNNENDFGGIKLVGRIECGSIVYQIAIDGSSYDKTDNTLGDPIIKSNLDVFYQ